MKLTYQQVFGAALLLAALAGCELTPSVIICEDGPPPPPILTTPANIQDIPSKLGPPVQQFIYDPTRENVFTGSQGTVILVSPNAFVTESGQPFTGPVHLEMREVFSKADMVLSAMPTISNGQLLESAGEFYLAPQEKVKWADGASVKFSAAIPASVTSMSGMQMFVGATPGAGTSRCFQWQPVDSSALTTDGQIATGQVSGAVLNAGYDWINFDRFLPDAPKDTIIANIVGEEVDLVKNTVAYVLFNTDNTAIKICEYAGPGKIKSPGIPLGSAVSIVVIRTLNGKLYYNRQKTVVNGRVNVEPALLEITPNALVDSLKIIK
ncbi:hypothetical protein LRS06_17280 [Hymenobacter sp. J193]|uniref:hypothetical protein n=1 Tax=Hymenobacter sp. J193 TaxID=2898429 RepID=UPI0021510B46|nr:hypothetical protein [Hymenobacter sp. J193]MCR5889491.1 hypothetical protein [Hymenobacter sp. J193]